MIFIMSPVVGRERCHLRAAFATNLVIPDKSVLADPDTDPPAIARNAVRRSETLHADTIELAAIG